LNFLENIDIEDYYYELPEKRIAHYPLPRRDRSKLLIYKEGKIHDDLFRNIGSYLPPGCLLVFNNTRVIQARLIFTKKTGAKIEVLLLEPASPENLSVSLNSTGKTSWKCMTGNLKRWKSGTLEKKILHNGKMLTLSAMLKEKGDGCQEVQFIWNGRITFGEVIENAGLTPLPPYIKRDPEEGDRLRYQTVYSSKEGSVAAPTAGLHFTPPLIRELGEKGMETGEITLHVGAGTFTPVKSPRIEEHEMHAENFSVTPGTIKMLRKYSGNIIAVGTTSVRVLESLHLLGEKISTEGTKAGRLCAGQWEWCKYGGKLSFGESLDALEWYMKKNKLQELNATTRIMIVPGYNFRSVRGMITNFHQPGSTLLLLVAAFAGNEWKKIYSYALENDYRFLSYGDSSLLLKV